ADSLAPRPPTGSRYLRHALQRFHLKGRCSKGVDRRLDARKRLGNPLGFREEAEQGDTVESAGKCTANEHAPARMQHPAEFPSAGTQIWDVVDDRGQPGAITAPITQWNVLGIPGQVRDSGVRSPVLRFAPHRVRRLN